MVKFRSVLSILAGLSFWGAFAPLQWWPMAFLGSSFLFISLLDVPIKIRLFRAFLAGVSFFGPLLHWTGIYVGAFPWLALTFLEASIFALIGILAYQRNFRSSLHFALLFTLLELLRMKAPFGGFGWGRVGFTQISPLHNLYPLLSVTGISLLVSLVGAYLTKRRFRTLVMLTLLIICAAVISNSENSPVKAKLIITAVQGGVDELGLRFNARALSVLRRHAALTQGVPQGSDLIIWPENASDIDPIKDPAAASILWQTIRSAKTPLLIGAVEQGSVGPSNSSLLFSPTGELNSRYIKQDLAPFGEYIPIRPIVEFFNSYAERVIDFQPGDHWVRPKIKDLTFASLICFEVLDDDHVRSGAEGTNFLIAQTNNATFGTSSQAKQQLQITQARAAELNREFAVVSTTGWTAHIGSRGQELATIPQFQPGTLRMEITGERGETFAGHLRSWMWTLGLSVLLMFSRWRYRR